MNRVLIGIAAFAMWTGAVFLYGNSHGKKTIANAVNTATIEATKKAREEEQDKQEIANAISKQQYDDVSTINATLIADIAKLHKRESRRNLSKDSKPRCSGAIGSDLSRQDSEFLTGEAARADKIRTALGACYKYADEVVGEKK